MSRPPPRSPLDPDPTTVPLDELRARLYSAVVCDVLDDLGYREQSPRVDLRSLTVDGVLIGRSKTTRWEEIFEDDPETYEREPLAVDGSGPDDVFVAAAAGSRRAGLWGELLSTAARNRGCVGAIVDGGVRDVAKMRQMAFPVFARSTCLYDTKHRARVAEIDVPVEIGGVTFHPGALVIGDLDGVVVVPPEVEAEAIRRACEKVDTETAVRGAIRQGLRAMEAWKRFGTL